MRLDRSRGSWVVCGVALLLAGWQLGCTPDKPSGKINSKQGQNAGHQGDEHAGHEHGPHDGELAEVGNEEYHLEWIANSKTGRVTIYVLDSTGKKEYAIPADPFEITVRIGEDEPTKYPIDPVDPTGEPAMTAEFGTTSHELADALRAAGKTADVEAHLKIGDESFTVEFTQGHHH